jgi:hypothetical protein
VSDDEQDVFGESADVAWQLGPTTVYGTVVRPRGAGPFPAVVMVAGSGPTDRDWCSPLLPGDNGSARLLAAELARAGFVSLRYDKRASGPHAAENMRYLVGKLSMQSHVEELTGAVRTVAAGVGVRANRIFALGNSEGTLHAMRYQADGPGIPLAGLVLAAPPGRVVGDVARSQLAEQAAAIPDGDRLMDRYDAAIARFLAEEPTALDPALPEGVRMLLQSLETPANLPFARELWKADPVALLGQVYAPVLIEIGKRDIQVDWQADGEPLRRAAGGHQDVTFQFPEHANHVLKHEPRPRSELAAGDVMARYNAPDARLDPEALSGMLDWLAARV